MMVRSDGWTGPLATAGAGVLLVALAGGLATDVGPWNQALRKPFFQPPGWLFGPVWSVIFALIAFAAADWWRNATTVHERRRLLGLFAVNATLNVLWSVLFFKVRRPDWALAEIVLLWVSIAALIRAARRTSPRSALLLLPYLVWVTFAAVLNLAIVMLNRPF